ncbi:MAG: UDP-2,3-diacylglucosamine diphosphatase [Alistipes sp.]|nr:UDP-2,3-diacylglucosamine diphosphatase [Alistipes sp.]
MYYFASDVHLGAGDPAQARRVERRFAAWLDRVGDDAEAIFILGDLFDFWFEYRRVVPQGFVRILGRLAALTDRGVRVVFITGNHDMWVGDYLHRECGVEVHTAPLEIALAGRRLFLAHGDNLKIERRPLLRFMNAVFRSRPLRWLFARCVHPDLALRFGQWWSGKSRKSHRNYVSDDRTTDPLVAYAREYAAASSERPDCFIFGHMHWPRDYAADGLRVLCLGDWSAERPVYAAIDPEGCASLREWS